MYDNCDKGCNWGCSNDVVMCNDVSGVMRVSYRDECTITVIVRLRFVGVIMGQV